MAGIETRIALRGDIKDVMQKMDQFSNRTKNANIKAQSHFQKTTNIASNLSRVIGMIGAGMAFRSIIQSAGDFQNSMARVKAITNATDTDFQMLKNTAQELGRTTQFTASQAAEGLQFLGMAGYNATQSVTALPSVLNLAAAGAIDLGTAADIASNVVSGMGYKIDQTNRVVDVLAQVSRKANTNVTEMGEGAKVAAPVFAGLDLEIEELATSMAILANNGIKGSEAGTAIAQSLSRLLRQPKMVSDGLNQLGVTITESSLKTDGFIGTLEKLRNAGINNTQMAQIFGEHWKSISTIINTSQADIDALSTSINNSNGVAKQMAEDGVGAWQRGVNQLNSAIEGLMIKLGEGGLLSFMTNLVTNITTLVSKITGLTGSFENAIPIIYATATAITVLYAAMTGGISAIITAVAAVAVGFISYWNDIIKAVENGINAVIEFINEYDALRIAVVTISEYFKFFYNAVSTYFQLLFTIVKEVATGISNAFKAVWNEIKSWFSGEEFDFGAAMADNFKKGFETIVEDGKKIIGELQTDLENGIKNIRETAQGKKIGNVDLSNLLTTGTGSSTQTNTKDNNPLNAPKQLKFDYDESLFELNEQLEIIDSENIKELKIEMAGLQSLASGLASSFLEFGKGFKEGFKAMGQAVKNFANQVIQQLITKGVMKLLGSLLTGGVGGGLFNGLLGFSGGGTVPKFANGGIIGGNSYYGDKILARVNSGEMIANQKQQKAIWSAMSASNGMVGNVTFEIKGDRLVGVLNNIQRKTNINR